MPEPAPVSWLWRHWHSVVFEVRIVLHLLGLIANTAAIAIAGTNRDTRLFQRLRNAAQLCLDAGSAHAGAEKKYDVKSHWHGHDGRWRLSAWC